MEERRERKVKGDHGRRVKGALLVVLDAVCGLEVLNHLKT